MIWKTDMRLLGKLMLPYLRALITVLIAAAGIIALIEMINFVADEYSVGSIITIYGTQVNTATVLPWVVFSIMAIIGIGLCRLSFAFVTRNWENIMETVKERMLV